MAKISREAAQAEKNFAVIDGKTGAIEPVVPKINLSSLDDVRLEMAKVYREMRARRLESSDGTRLVYVLGQLAKLHETVEIAKRLAALEMAIGARG